MTRAQAAHLNLMAALREKTRTHEWQPYGIEQGHKRTPEEDAELRKRLREMEAKGLTRRQMASECGCTHRTVRNHLGPTSRRGRIMRNP
jgi:DNA invertase Pin-like site-specific DNA recombinase